MIPQVIDSRTAPSSYVWQPEGRNPRVEFSPSVLTALRRRLLRPVANEPREFGGILLGAIDGAPGSWVTRVQACELFPIEHRSGLAYTLAPHDRNQLARRLQRLGRQRLKPVGLFRSHERRGLYMDQRDFELFQAHSGHPASIFLLVSEDHEHHAKAGVFIWEEGDVQRHVSYQEFPLDETGDGSPRETFRVPAPEPNSSTASLPVLPRLAAAFTKLREQSSSELGFRPLALGFLAVALPLAAFYGGRELAVSQQRRVVAAGPEHEAPVTPAAASPSSGPFKLHSQPSGKYLEFQWDPRNEVIRQAQLARLSVSDGPSQVQVWLVPADLASGRYLYAPAHPGVTAKLDLYSHLGGQTISAVPDKP